MTEFLGGNVSFQGFFHSDAPGLRARRPRAPGARVYNGPVVSTIQSWQLGEELGRGALGRVVRVHGQDGSVCAGKILHPSHRSDPAAQSRFVNEATHLADLDHANLVRIVGLAAIDGEQVLLMELIDGPSLATIIARAAPLPADRAITLARGMAAGLAAAHRAGLVHRDLKPANVLVTGDDVPKIVDFGMARAASLAGMDASAFAVAGTPDYMPPEAIDPLAVDTRSDLYSLGCILHEMLAGQPPFTGATAFAVLEAHRNAPIPEVPEEHAPPALRALVCALLAKSPADRPQSANAVLEALQAMARRTADANVADVADIPGDRTGLAPIPTSQALDASRLFTRAAPARGTRGTIGQGGTCASCGRPLVPGVPACFDCGAEQPTLTAGRMTVFVVGPGGVAEKLPAGARQRLLAWLHANPSLGLDPAPLAKRVPRLPFVLATGVSEASARALTSSVEALGLTCTVRRGNRFMLGTMQRKALQLSGRIAVITLGPGFALLNTALMGSSFLVAGAVGSLAAGWYLAGRRIARPARQPGLALPEAITQALERVAGVLPAIDHARHRDSLRAVVQRALELRQVMHDATPRPVGHPGGHAPGQPLDPAARAELDSDIARLIDLAVVAASRIDELEQALTAEALARPTPEIRNTLRERDAWAARLLDTTAHLDALRVRWAALRHAGDAAGMDHGDAGQDSDDQRLADLRAHIEALEEVQT